MSGTAREDHDDGTQRPAERAGRQAAGDRHPAGGAGAATGSVGVTVNGQRREVPAGGSAHDLVVALGLAGRPLAVEVNGRVVPRARLADCMLEAESVIEIVTLVGGG